MQSKNSFQTLLPVLWIFIISIAIGLVFKEALTKTGFNIFVLSVGNFILFLATAGSFLLFQKALQNNNPHVVLRMIYSGLALKMFVCVVAMLAYVLVMRNEVNKMAIFGWLGLYCIYTFTEIKILMRLSRRQKNG
ncbi:MAG TPA: hypothetical protein VKR53_02360 [Puia sp.]|nr:hypothetical protein [Puia sp.]